MPAVINIEGPITELTPIAIREALAAEPAGDIVVNLNSQGGNAFAGFAAFNLLKQSGRPVVVNVLGVAASAAAPILAAARTVTAAKNASIMIHEPSIQTNGDAAAHANNSKLLSDLHDSFVDSLAAKMNWTPDKIASALKATTWFTASEAHAAGLVNEIIDTAAIPLACTELDYTVPLAVAELLQPAATLEALFTLRQSPVARVTAKTTTPAATTASNNDVPQAFADLFRVA